MTYSPRGTVLLLILALVWGSNYLWIKVSLGGFSATTLTFARLLMGAAFLFAVVVVRKHKLPRDRESWRHLAVAALLGNAAPYLLFAVGETRIDSAIAGALNATTPLWTVALALMTRTQPRLATVHGLGLVLGFLGCLLIFSPWHTDRIDLLGAAACLAAAFSYAVSYLYIGKYVSDLDHTPLSLSACQLMAGTIWITPVLPFDGTVRSSLPISAILGLIVLGIVGTGWAYVLNYALIRQEGPTSASIVGYLLPVVSVVLGVMFMDEPFTWTLGIGTLAVMIGVGLARTRRVSGTTASRAS